MRGFAAVSLLALAGCSAPSELAAPPPSTSSTLPAGIVARAGPLAISSDAVARAAEARRVSPRTALDEEIRTALFAAAAWRDGYDEAPSTRAALRGRLARAELERLRDESQKTDIADAEVADATARHFVDLDRPEAFRVIHALVHLPEDADAASTARAKALAERVAEQVASALDPDDFKRRAEATPDRGGLELTVESLKPVAADGRVVDLERPSGEPEHYAPPFARAASRLAQPGQKSPVVRTEFGFHVLMLLERYPPKSVPFEERRQMLREEILTERAKRLKRELLGRLSSATPPNVERSADALLTTVGAARREEEVSP